MVDEESDLIAALGRSMMPDDKALKDAWFDEYVQHWDPYHAAIRAGFRSDSAAKAFVKKVKSDRYIQLKIARYKERQRTENDDVVLKAQVENTMIEVMTNPYAQSAARVSAAKALMDMKGFNAPKKADINVNHSGRVMVVPAIANLDDWEAAAVQSQDLLVADARRDLQ